MGLELFENRILTIATMHRKEQVIQPLLEKSLQVKCIVPSQIDTDVLGTFSGEVERKNDPISTLRLKCELGFQLTKTDLVIASEGSFGQHPHLFFSKANEEVVMLKDRLNKLEILGSHLTTETNFDGQEVIALEEVIAFAEKNLFPSHGMILKPSQHAKTGIEKGIVEINQLTTSAEAFLKKSGICWIESDMRAMYNPTRMRAIQVATSNLIQKLESLCPSCQYPGFWISDVTIGLPCSLCGSATRSTYSHTYHCSHCQYEEEKKFPYSKQLEDPMYCDSCNP